MEFESDVHGQGTGVPLNENSLFEEMGGTASNFSGTCITVLP